MPRNSVTARRPSLGSDLLVVPPPGVADANLFRPRGSLVGALLLAPIMVFLGLVLAALLLGLRGEPAQILLGIGSGALAGWLLSVISLARVLLPQLHLTADGLVVRSPLGGSQRIRWSLIERAELTMGLLRLQASDGVTATVLIAGQTDGGRLLRETILRVSPGVLGPPLQRQLAAMGGSLGGVGGARDRRVQFGVAPVWFALAGGIALGGAALATWGSLTRAGVVLAAGVVVGLAGAALLVALRQRIVVDEHGLTVHPGIGATHTLTWDAIVLVTRSQLDMWLSLNSAGQRRAHVWGPFFFGPLDRQHFQQILRARLLEHNVHTLTRRLL